MNNNAISVLPVRTVTSRQQGMSIAQVRPVSLRVAELEAECARLRLALARKEQDLEQKEKELKAHYDGREGLRTELANYRWLRSNATLHRSIIKGSFEIRVQAPMEVPIGLDDLVGQIRTQHQSPA
ncbi:hypothetical protein EGJ52_23655 [Pseudomonas luteola]|uniref:hypothetical protein n=1 Tax=Pseudomonas luteola TaxID=47886 RepID=UPI000F787EDC|nr:hypothetical protein [Pseudomonas luteola]RRW39816.1 hypothetical protein EGJ52_23655 [Pseudomonas luteola]